MSDGIREAASVIAARDARDGIEVLVLERSAASRFLPGYVAFPGGAVEAGDAELAERWFGSVDDVARACAVRELFEEVGLALTDEGMREAGDGSLDSIGGSAPRPERLAPIARWIAPERVPVRFDAHYFAVAAADGLDPRPDGREVVRAWWMSPAALLDDWRNGRRKLYWPTFFTVCAIERCATVAELLELRLRTREPAEDELESLPRSTFWQE